MYNFLQNLLSDKKGGKIFTLFSGWHYFYIALTVVAIVAVFICFKNKDIKFKIISLKNKVAMLEQMLGQKQILIEFQQKMIELAEEEYGIDIKKKLETEPSSISEKTGKNTPSR